MHGIHARKHGLVNRAADRVQQLFQRMPRVRLRRVGPEEKEQLITAAALFACGGKDSEQRQPTALVSMLAEESVVFPASECERPERPKTIAIRRMQLRGCVRHDANLEPEVRDGKKPMNLSQI